MSPLRDRLGQFSAPRVNLRARLLAAGLGSGQHRAERRGSGIEFAGHRPYTPGDDLRHLDRHALLRHGRRLIREFHTETERTLWLIIDASPSMLFQSANAAESKRGLALLLGAALARAARRSGDPVGLVLVRAEGNVLVPPRLGADHFERLLDVLESEDAKGPSKGQAELFRAFSDVARLARRGAHIVVLSDLLDDSPSWSGAWGELTAQRRQLTVAQLLDPDELTFPFRGPTRFVAAEGALVIDTDGERAREGYLAALAAHTDALSMAVRGRGGHFLQASTAAAPRDLLARLAGRPA